jgi:CRISPR-associated protein Cmr2
MLTSAQNIAIALAWCYVYRDPKARNKLDALRNALQHNQTLPEPWKTAWKNLKILDGISPDYFPDHPTDLIPYQTRLAQPETRIGLVYGGATKIKQYVFETENLQDIRGASAILDRINLIDLPAFFGKSHDPDQANDQAKGKGKNKDKNKHKNKADSFVDLWLQQHFPDLKAVLIPELIIYSTGGNLLALCPAPYVHQLADAIERYYTEVTLTANSCAVGDTFKLLEFKFGLLADDLAQTPWFEHYQQIHALETSTSKTAASPEVELKTQFRQRKNFNELVTQLTGKFHQRRNGNDTAHRDYSRRYPPLYETHPYIQRDDSGLRSTVDRIAILPSNPKLSEASARKRYVGQLTKRDDITGEWLQSISPDWQAGKVESWVSQFEQYLDKHPELKQAYQGNSDPNIHHVSEARSLPEIGQTSQPNGYIAYIYADGNNMGQYIQHKIHSPEAYQEFSQVIFDATQHAVYRALATHLQPTTIQREMTQDGKTKMTTASIHPFEIIAIGGDDVFLVVPADKALAIAKTIGEEFETLLLAQGGYEANMGYQPWQVHRCRMDAAATPQCKLSLSTGVLIAAENTPVYYAQKLVEQLLKSAKQRAKTLKAQRYLGGTVDFLVMKAVTLVSSDLKQFRQQALTKVSSNQQQTLKLYGAPYTLHELGTLLDTAAALKKSKFPRNQLYQIRSFLEQGKQTAILNYRYFQARLSGNSAPELRTAFDDIWCKARSNDGNIAPWMSHLVTEPPDATALASSSTANPKPAATYETIWWDLVDLYPFTADGQPPPIAAQPSSRKAIPKPKIAINSR